MKYLVRPFYLWLILLAGLACSLPGLGGSPEATTGSAPVVTISQPAGGQNFSVGQEVLVQSTAVDVSGIERVELVVDGETVWVDANAAVAPDVPFIVAQPWIPTVPGSHVIQVQAHNAEGQMSRSEPLTVQVVEAGEPVAQGPTASPPATATPVAPIEDVPTATPAPPTATPIPPTATPAPPKTTPIPPTATTPPPLGTAAPNTPTNTPLPPTVTPTPGHFEPTGREPDGRFKDIWQEIGGGESRLGHPTSPEYTDQDFARQYFENGMMFWWDNPEKPDYIWVIDAPDPDLMSGTSWNRYEDEWNGADEYPCPAAGENKWGPMRGFGQLWCDRPEIRERVGDPREGESGSAGSPPYAHVQFFQGGAMLYNPFNSEVYVLLAQGDWLRFGY